MKLDHLQPFCAECPHQLLFATVSGSHLYGFSSPDSDVDMRGVHILPARTVMSLRGGQETVEVMGDRDGLELDLVTHDVAKFMKLMLNPNGYVLEQLYSPLIVKTTPEHDELKRIGRGCFTRNHVRHYRGFAKGQWKLFNKDEPRRVKPLLYVFRVLLTGIYLMRSGELDANLPNLNQIFRLTYIDELIDRKTSGPEKGTLGDSDLAFFTTEFERLDVELAEAGETSELPPEPSAEPELDDLLWQLRRQSLGS